MTPILSVIRMSELPPQPWKNGGGVTTEIAASPSTAALDTFDWRVSMAQISSDGPFSLFPGIDRTLTVIEGYGMQLAIADRQTVTLNAGTPPLSFAGDIPASVTLTAGPLIDLNVMTRRGRYHHVVEPIAVGSDSARVPPRWHGSAGRDADILVFCATGAVAIRAGDDFCRLAAHDTCRIARDYFDDLLIEPLKPKPAQLYLIVIGSAQSASAARPAPQAVD